MKSFSLSTLALTALLTLQVPGQALAMDTYKIDTEGAHAFVQFRIRHLGYSWLYGRFDKFDGTLLYDAAAPEKSKITVTVDVASINSNHAKRDKHLRGEDFLDVKKFPTAKFESTSVQIIDSKNALLKGQLTLHGVTREISIPVSHVGGGDDPWGGFRQGFSGSTTLRLKDFDINYDLGPASTEVELLLDIETIRQ